MSLSASSSSSSAAPRGRSEHQSVSPEINTIAQRWSKPILVCSPELQAVGITEIQLNEQALRHVFEPKKNSSGGYHYLEIPTSSSSSSQRSFNVSSTDKYTWEGFMSVNYRKSPKFKSLFKSSLTREEVVAAWAESLKNVISVTPSEKGRFKVQGKSASCGNRIINTILEPAAGSATVVTFFPEPASGISDEERLHEQSERSKICRKHFGNPSNLPERSSVLQTEMESLELFGTNLGISDWRLATVDENTPESYAWMSSIGASPRRFMRQTLIDDRFLARNQMHQHHFVVHTAIPPLSIPASTLQSAFMDEAAWPKYLQCMEILTYLKDALDNFLSDPFGDDELNAAFEQVRPDVQQLRPRSLKTRLKQSQLKKQTPYRRKRSLFKELQDSVAGGAKLTSNGQVYRLTKVNPHITDEKDLPNGAKNLISFTCRSRGLTDSPADPLRWTFRVKLDPSTGCIHEFYLLNSTEMRI